MVHGFLCEVVSQVIDFQPRGRNISHQGFAGACLLSVSLLSIGYRQLLGGGRRIAIVSTARENEPVRG